MTDDYNDGVEILSDALAMVARHGDRGQAYGHPAQDYAAVTAAFNAFTRRTGARALTPAEGVLFMCCVKLAREGNRHATDNLTDLAGYAACLEMLHRKETP